MPCGAMCWWGTAKVLLSERPKKYSQDSLFLAIQCIFGKPEEFIGKHVKASVTKLRKPDLHKGCDITFNRFDSWGIPFYRFLDDEAELWKLW
jgi:hypothetical protein